MEGTANEGKKNPCGLVRTRDLHGNLIIGRRKGNDPNGPISRRHYCRMIPKGKKGRPDAQDLKWCESGLTGRCRRSPPAGRRYSGHRNWKSNTWVNHVRAYRTNHPSLSYAESLTKARKTYMPVRPAPQPVVQKGGTGSAMGMVRDDDEGGKTTATTVGSRLTVDPISLPTVDSAGVIISAITKEEVAHAHRVARREGGTVVRIGPLRRRAPGRKRGSRFSKVVLARVGAYATKRSADRELHNYGRLHRAGGICPRVLWAGHSVVVVAGIARTLAAAIRSQEGVLTAKQQQALVYICTAPDTYLHSAQLKYITHVIVVPLVAAGGSELVLIHPVGISVYPTTASNRSVGLQALRVVRNLLVPSTTGIIDTAIGDSANIENPHGLRRSK